MTRLGRLLPLTLVFILLPGAARADGIIDWIEKWSGPKLGGVGYDLNVFCTTAEGRTVKFCEFSDVSRRQVRHMVDARFIYYWKYGKTFFDYDDGKAINAWKLMGMYHYRVVDWLDLGAGAGYLHVTGGGFDGSLSRAVLTPVSLIVAPFKPARRVRVRFEESFITTGFSAADFGAGGKSAYDSHGGEWNASVGLSIAFFKLRP